MATAQKNKQGTTVNQHRVTQHFITWKFSVGPQTVTLLLNWDVVNGV